MKEYKPSSIYVIPGKDGSTSIEILARGEVLHVTLTREQVAELNSKLEKMLQRPAESKFVCYG